MTTETPESTTPTELSLNQRAMILVIERIKELEIIYARVEARGRISKSPSIDDCTPSSIRRVKEMLDFNKGYYEWLQRMEGNEIH